MRNINEALRIFLWSYVVVFVVICSLGIIQTDIWWQLSEGMHLLKTFSLPHQPAAAFGFPSDPYFDEYAGYEVVLTLVYKATGFIGLWLLFSAIYLAIIFFPLAYSRRKRPVFDTVSIASVLIAAYLMRSRFVERPDVVGSLLLVLLMIVLRNRKLETITLRSSGSLFFIFFVWTNTHSSFVVGLFTLCIWGVCEIILKFRNFPIKLLVKNALLIGAVALFAAMLNPYGTQRFLFPFLQMTDFGGTALSVEMWPVTNFQTQVGQLILIATVLLAWAILISRGIPPWLIIFSLFSLYESLKGCRFVNLLAIALLFVDSSRGIRAMPKMWDSMPVGLCKSCILGCLCIFMLLLDSFSFKLAYEMMGRQRPFATNIARFAPDIVCSDVFQAGKRSPALSAHGEGSFLSFEENKGFRPLLDSGMSHFSDDTKRYFFFLWHEPEAFNFAVDHLNVKYIVINNEIFHLLPELQHCPGWKLVACSENGMLWQRVSGGIQSLAPSDATKVEQAKDTFLQNGDVIDAFCYSTVLDEPLKSLSIISKSGGFEWSEPFFNSFCAWVNALPKATIEEFLASAQGKRDSLVYAVLSARLGSEKYAQFIKTVPPGTRPWGWAVVQIRYDLTRGDFKEAREIFDTFPTTQLSSVIYYRLWHEVRSNPVKANEDSLSAYGQWQTWDDSSRKFFESMTARLNDRIAYLDASDSP